MTAPLIAALLTYVLMLAAMYWHRMRRFHVSVMASIIVFDVSMPFYLAATNDWQKRLIEDGDILAISVWMHFGLIITLFVLYAIQVQAGLKVWRFYKQGEKQKAKQGTREETREKEGDENETIESMRGEHRALAKGVLLLRALVIGTGAALIDSAPKVI